MNQQINLSRPATAEQLARMPGLGVEPKEAGWAETFGTADGSGEMALGLIVMPEAGPAERVVYIMTAKEALALADRIRSTVKLSKRAGRIAGRA